MSQQQISLSQGRILISGELTFATVAAVLEASYRLFPAEGPWNCDFSQVTVCDSASVALVLEWLSLARQRRRQLQFTQLPQQLKSIAAAAGLASLLDAAIQT